MGADIFRTDTHPDTALADGSAAAGKRQAFLARRWNGGVYHRPMEGVPGLHGGCVIVIIIYVQLGLENHQGPWTVCPACTVGFD